MSKYSIHGQLKNYNKGDKLKVKVLEIKKDQQKVRIGLRQTKEDPFDFFKDKKVNDTITVKVLSSDSKGLLVRPEGCKLDFVIKKSQIAISAVDARPSRFVGSERIDASIAPGFFSLSKKLFCIQTPGTSIPTIENSDDTFSTSFSSEDLSLVFHLVWLP